ncbi:hypothetical protein V6Z05_04205 [Leptospira venezuelensis]|uniref:hypothetical protein n=1 Tax=Leptospira venezuelensis TaxID=1958811 RepID=UPI000A3980C5|nr:hypothetical protein [Leptospira venezuelensis]
MKLLIFSIFLVMYVSCTANSRVENKNISVAEGQAEKKGRTIYRVLSKKEYLVNKTILSGGSREIYEAIRKKNSKLKEKGNAIFCGEFNPQTLTIRIQYVAKEYDDMKHSLLQLTENSPNIYTVHFGNEPLHDGIFQETDDQADTKFWQIGLFPVGAIPRISNPTNDLGIFTNRFFDVKSIALNKKKIDTIRDCIMNFRIQWCGEQANPKDREWPACDPPGNEY